MQSYIDAKGLVQAYGGSRGVVQKITKAGLQPPAIKTIEKWIERKSIPSNQLVLLEHTSRRLGLPVTVTTYFMLKDA